MDIVIYVVIAIAALVVAYFIFLRGKGQQLDAGPPATQERLPPPSVRKKGEVVPEALPPAALLPAEPSRPVVVRPTPPPPPARKGEPAERPLNKEKVAAVRKGLAATRAGFFSRLAALFTGKKEIDPAILEQLEEVMLSADVGVKTTQSILERLRERLDNKELGDTDP